MPLSALAVALPPKPLQSLLAGHDVTKLLDHVFKCGAMFVVGQRCATVGHHHHLEVEHHGVARGRFAADVGLGAGNEHGIDVEAAQQPLKPGRAGDQARCSGF